MTYQLTDIVAMEQQLEMFFVDLKIAEVQQLKLSGNLLSSETVDSWFANLLSQAKKFDTKRYNDIAEFCNNLKNITDPYTAIHNNNQNSINKNIKRLELFRSKVEGNIAKSVTYPDNDQLTKKLHSIIDHSAFGYTGKISAMQTRLLEMFSSETCQYFWQCEQDALDDYLKELKYYVDAFLEDCVKIKNQTTLEILNDRRHDQTVAWIPNEDDQTYLNRIQPWEDDVIVDKFLGLVGQYVDWKFPIAYIDPNTGSLIRHIISGDPFYVIDDRKLPYENLLKALPAESQKKICKYTKKTAESHLEESSIGMCVSWNNYPFMAQGKIFNDVTMVAKLLRPGGFFVFNYADAHSINGAKFTQDHLVPIFWKERLDRFTSENNLVEISSHEFDGYPFKVAIYQKIGNMPELPITNKLGLVLPNESQLAKKRLEETEEYRKSKASRSKLEYDLKLLKERDKLLKDLDSQRQLGNDKVLHKKLQNAINHLNSALLQYNNDYTHSSVLESILHVSKLTYSIGRIKDSKNIIKRVARDIEKMSEKNLIARKFREWQNFLNNIDT